MDNSDDSVLAPPSPRPAEDRVETPPLRSESAAWPQMQALLDLLLILAVFAVSFVPFAPLLGLYSDDWLFMEQLSTAPDQSLTGLTSHLFHLQPHARMRPLHLFYTALQYFLFGEAPPAFHLTNGLVLYGALAFFYLFLRALALPRALAVSVPILYALLPHCSTTRLWFAAAQANLSMLFFFFASWSLVAAVRAGAARRSAWSVAAIIAVVASGLSYEPVLSLALVSGALAWRLGERRRWVGPLVLFPATAVSVALIKAAVTVRVAEDHSFASSLLSARYLSQGWDVLEASLIDLGVELPMLALRLLGDQTALQENRLLGALAVVILLGISIALFVITRGDGAGSRPLLSRGSWSKVALAGLAVFALGYAVFLPVGYLPPVTAGDMNRTAVASTAGVALFIAGIVGFGCRWLGSFGRLAFAAIIGVIAAAAFIVSGSIAAFWIASGMRQEQMIAGVRAHLPVPPAGSVVLLDQTCFTEHPGPLFNLDFGPALRHRFGRRDVTGNSALGGLAVGPDGVGIRDARFEPQHYPWGGSLFAYLFISDDFIPLTGHEAAAEWLERRQVDCPAPSVKALLLSF
ncbi:MAG TPA: hypothetical protein VMT00_15460 [Thermoanaerobaculia bacterium]|nr:hypothetical protein [Thermoanaerobaculia bacterium]